MLKELKFLLLVVIVIIGLQLLKNMVLVDQVDSFHASLAAHPVEDFAGRSCGATCPSTSSADAMCDKLAADNCRVPRTMLNDCWLNTYRECANNCSNSVCNCHAEATAKCGSCDDPAIACYNTVHQECMAGMGHGVDPDRGAI